MKSEEPSPPRWAEAALQSLVRPSDRESISGDLLEEYREVRRPALGAFRANAWYVKHMLSVLWRLIRPCALALIAVTLLSLIPRVKGLSYGSLAQAPGVSLLDALIYLWAGYHGARRTRLIRTAVLAAGSTSFVGFTVLFAAFAIRTPGLLLVPFSKPFIFVILSVLLLMALGYSVAVGTLGGIIGRWLPPARAEARVS
jgi:hypothetical protein